MGLRSIHTTVRVRISTQENFTIFARKTTNRNTITSTTMIPSPQTLTEIRKLTVERLQQLQDECEAADAAAKSSTTTPSRKSSARGRLLDYCGFVHWPQFVDAATTCNAMKEEMAALVQSQWNQSENNSNEDTDEQQNGDPLDSFGTGPQQNVQRRDYFLESADQVHFFVEPDALLADDEDDEDKGADSGRHRRRQRLKPMYRQTNTAIAALNKVGHALHLLPEPSAFAAFATSDALRDAVVAELAVHRDPVVPQSMYIFKQATIGGAVHSHQDSTFLFTTPRQTCLGVWLALDDTTLENGCLWVRPRSHVAEGTRRHYRRNEAYFGPEAIAARSNCAASTGGTYESTGSSSSRNNGEPSNETDSPKPGDVPMFIMHDIVVDPNVPWDGGLPTNVNGEDCAAEGTTGFGHALLEAGFLPIECKAGDMLAFVGELDHLSLPNTSSQARHTFQLHLVEGPSQGIEWSPYNWLQYPDGKPFLRLRQDLSK